MTNATTNPPWVIRTLADLRSGRITGYAVERIHNPYTRQARAESLDRRIYRTHADAAAAIAKATA